jgi:hypothetical protein
MSVVIRIVTAGLVLCPSLLCFPVFIRLQRRLQHLCTLRDNIDGKPPYYCYQNYTACRPLIGLSLAVTAIWISPHFMPLFSVFVVAFELQCAVVTTNP